MNTDVERITRASNPVALLLALISLIGCEPGEGARESVADGAIASPDTTRNAEPLELDADGGDSKAIALDSGTRVADTDEEPSYFGGEAVFSELEVDFGDVLTDQILGHVFKLRNVGNEELRIWKVEGS